MEDKRIDLNIILGAIVAEPMMNMVLTLGLTTVFRVASSLLWRA